MNASPRLVALLALLTFPALAAAVPGTLQFSVASQEVSESAGAAVVTVSRSGGSTGAVSVVYSAKAGGDAELGQDYQPVTGTLTWLPGDAADKTFSVPLVDDARAEPRESFSMKLTNPAGGAVLGARRTHAIGIADDDSPPSTLQFAVSEQEVSEADQVAVVTVSRSGDGGLVSVLYSARAGGDAALGTDYQPVTGELVWGAGDTADKTFLVPIVDDPEVEAVETFSMKLTNPGGGAVIGARKFHTIAILDDDTLPPDSDGDDVADAQDNCPLTPNVGQADFDGDGAGDACDTPPACPPVGSTVIAEWDGHLEAGANVSGTGEIPLSELGLGDDVTPPLVGEQTALIASDVDMASFGIPAGCGITHVSVEISWLNPVEDLDLYVEGLEGQPGGSSAFVLSPEIAVIPDPAGNYAAHVVGFNNAGTDYHGRITVERAAGAVCSDGIDNDGDGAIDHPADSGCESALDDDEQLTACEQAYQGFGAAPAELLPTIPVGSAADLILTFADLRNRDRAAHTLAFGALLTRTDAATIHKFEHLPILVFRAALVTDGLLDGLRRELAPFKLGSIAHDRKIPLALDTSTPYIDAPAARQMFEVTGAGVGVAVMDSGIDTTQGDFANVVDNRKFVATAGIASPYGDTSSGHGTHVAGIVGGTGFSSDGRWVGVAPGATLLGYGNGDGDSVFIQSILASYDRMMDVRDQYNVRVTNNSYGGSGTFNRTDPVMVAVKRAYDVGIISVFAAGNNEATDSSPHQFTSYGGPCTITVANGDRTGQLNSGSSIAAPGATHVPTITAPGTAITSARAMTGAVTPPRTDNPRYATISGTSMAAPHIAGLIALMQEAAADASLPPLRFEDVVAIFEDTATPMFKTNGDPYLRSEAGFGYVNALAAVAVAAGEPIPPSPDKIPTVDETHPAAFVGSAGTTLLSLGCSGCEFGEDGITAYSGRHLFRIPAGIPYASVTAVLSWNNAAEKLDLALFAPDGRSATTVAEFFDTRLIDNATSLEAQRTVSLANPVPGLYEVRVADYLSASTPYTLTVSVACGAGGCVVPDSDGDGTADDADTDDDNDGVADGSDAFPLDAAESVDTDGDGAGNNADTDDDGDGTGDPTDAFPLDPAEMADTDGDGAGNNADADDDNDGVLDGADNCPLVANTGQDDADSDGVGDACVGAATNARVIVAVLDSQANPYHQFFRAGSPIYPAGSPPAAVTPEVLAELGIDAAHQIELSNTGNMVDDLASDAGKWAAVQRGQLYWFKGTNVIGISFRNDGLKLKPDVAKHQHGVGTSAAVLAANPEAIVMFVEVDANGSAATHEYALLTSKADIVSTSYGLSVPETGIFPPEVTTFAATFEGVLQKGKLHFSSGGNQPGFTPGRAGAGPWWSIGVSGHEEGTSEGRTTLSGNFPDFVADYTQRLPYCPEPTVPMEQCASAYNDFVGGTSFSTPRAAGVASRVLLEARRQLGHEGGIVMAAGKPVMAAGAGRTISNWQLRRALEEAAHIPTLADWDPIEAVFDIGGQPYNNEQPWLQMGWGELSSASEKGVIGETLARLGFGTPTRAKDPGFCDFQTQIIEERKLYWDNVAVLSDSWLVSYEDPFLYCAP